MYEFVVLVCIISFLIILGFLEYYIHRKNLDSIPIRIHVNGTRGKSSVTRLITSGLQAGGIRAFGKTTGSLPRMIMDDGTEYPVFRHRKANIIEQLRIVAFAASNKAQALVIECMALQPFLQSLSELRLVKSTIGVIVNAREDHLDVMGPEEKDVALALLGTTPVNSTLFTCERDYTEEFSLACRDRNSALEIIPADEIHALSDDEMDQFSYDEHKENVALALRVCSHLGVERETALRGMQKVKPDIGAMLTVRVSFFGRNILFSNGFAANDPESTQQIWEKTVEEHSDIERKIMVINTRLDRPDRSRQIGKSISQWTLPDRYILIGTGSHFVYKYAIKTGIDSRLFVQAEGYDTTKIFEEILNHCGKNTLVMGIGNIAGPGLELIHYFYNRAELENLKWRT